MFLLISGAIGPSDYSAMLHTECALLNRAGLTMRAEMAFDPVVRLLLEWRCDELTIRLHS